MEQVSKQVFCVDCEYLASSSHGDPDLFKCRCPENIAQATLNLVTGVTEYSWKKYFCHECRNDEATCGVTGKWFKERVFTIINKPTKPTGSPKKSQADEL